MSEPTEGPPVGLRPTTDIPIWIWAAPGAALALAILPLPYGYYTLLRLFITGISAFLAHREFTLNGGSRNLWVWALGGMALLYNPIVPFYSTKSVWIILNLISAVMLFAHYKKCSIRTQ
jgi:hypothetical protein